MHYIPTCILYDFSEMCTVSDDWLPYAAIPVTFYRKTKLLFFIPFQLPRAGYMPCDIWVFLRTSCVPLFFFQQHRLHSVHAFIIFMCDFFRLNRK